MYRRSGRHSMVLVGGAVALVVVIGVCRAGPRGEQMREAAAPTIRAIEHYAEQHGRYPASLGIAGTQAPFTAYGRFHYHASPDGSSCSLSAGSRVRDGFVLSWDCATRLWTTNPAMHDGPSTTAQADSAVLSEPDDSSASHEPTV